jgi:hypothetical protein
VRHLDVRRWFNPLHWVYVLAHVVVFLIGLLLITHGGTIAVSIGTSLVATGVAGWVVFVYVFLSQTATQQIALLAHFGFVSAFEARAARIRREYDERLATARKNIDVMGFGLRALREDYLADFARWASLAPVRILLIDPEGPHPDTTYARQRDLEEYNTPGAIESDVRQFVRKTKDLTAQGNGSRFQIRLYTCLPSVNIFRIDDELFWGPYLIRDQSRNMPTFVVRHPGVLFLRLCQHFESIWSDPKMRSTPESVTRPGFMRLDEPTDVRRSPSEP